MSVLRTDRVRSVGHVSVEKVSVISTRRSNGGDVGVEEEI